MDDLASSVEIGAGAQGEASAGKMIGRIFRGDIRFEPSLHRQLLPACRNCGDKHPQAYAPPINTGKCPSCGQPASVAGPMMISKPVATGVFHAGPTARLFLAIGKKLMNLAERISR